uniref:hypothetical protein n=1 Tax=Angelakisella sp. TaxID=1935177 RepID=UPI004028B3FB
MKKRVSSILLAAVLCVTMLSVVALADECQHDWEYKDTGAGLNCIGTCKICKAESYPVQHCDIVKDGKCDYCNTALAVSFNDIYRSCATTWEAAFKEIGSTSGTLYPIADTTETITYNGNGNVTINVTGKTLNNLTLNSGKVTLKHNEVYDGASTVKNVTVTGGTLKIEGNSHLTVTTLKISANAKVELSGGTYGEITGVTDKNTLLGPGYVFDTDGKTVVEAPIKSVTASVTGHNNAKYGYTAEQAPVLTATVVAPDNATGVTYQWYKVNGSKKTAIDNATAQTYTVETGLNAGGYDYCCTATVDTYSLTSGDVTVTIKKANGPQLGTINVNQVYNDTASKTINIYDYIGTDLNKLAKDAGTLRFHTGTYSPTNTIESGWGVDVNTGAITYQLAEGLSVGQTITITMQVGYNEAYSKNHEDATVTVNIALTMATPTGTPNYTPITSSGKTLADAHLNADNNVFSVPGTVKWVGETDELDPSTVPVEKDKAYTWKFTPQLDNYESITGSIILWTESGSGVVIITPSQSGESTPASNPNTGAAHVGQPLPGLALLALAALCLYAGTRRF